MAKKAKKTAKKRVYTKTHTDAKVAAIHIKKIQAKGGTVTKEKDGKNIKLTYSY
jgi:hypothetical protein